MAQTIILHAVEDGLPARALAEKLRKMGIEVALDLPLGEEARAASSAAQAIVVLWSPRSAQMPEFVSDAEFVQSHPQTIHAVMQSAQPPAHFLQQRGVNLSGWRGEEDFKPWRQLAKFVAEAMDAPAPAPPPQEHKVADYFPEPKADATAPGPAAVQAPAAANSDRGRKPPKLLIALSALAIAGVGAVALLNKRNDQAPGQVETGAGSSAAAWEDVDVNNADELRAFIARNGSALEEEARRALAELEEHQFEAAMEADLIEGFRTFLADFPESRFRNEILERIEEKAREETPPPMASEQQGASGEPAAEGERPDASGGPADLTPSQGETGEPSSDGAGN